MQTVSDIGERGLIKIISEILGGLGNEILSGEDDAVAIPIRETSTLLINSDMLVSTTDVPSNMTLFQAARKAVVMSVSDIMVKGGIPKWAVVALGVQKNLKLDGEQGFKGLIQGLKAGFKEYEVQYLGGDLNETKETIISCTIIGNAPYGVISRSGAKPGHLIFCTDKFGKTGCGFAMLLENKDPLGFPQDIKQIFVDSVLIPTTSSIIGQILAKNLWASASCDSSDGIYNTLHEICKASGVGAILYLDMLPIADGVEEFCSLTNKDLINLIFNAGEEFLHIFTIPPKKVAIMKNYLSKHNLKMYKIGSVTKNTEISLKIDKNHVILLDKMGYEHLKKKKKNEPMQ